MRSTIRSLARPWRITLFGALTVLAAALPAGADPTLVYSSYLGGSSGDMGFAVAAQGGNTFIAGTTNSLDYPVVGVSSTKPWGETFQVQDVFVTALGPSGIPFYSTYIAVSRDDYEYPIEVLGIGAGPDGSAYVVTAVHHRWSADTSLSIEKLAPSGEIAWRQGSGGGRVYYEGMTVDFQGNVYITGRYNGENPYPNHPYHSAYLDEAFVWKINVDGSFGYWSVIDGNGSETGQDIAVDAAGNAYVLGSSDSTNLPRALQPAPGPAYSYNAFVTKLDPTGSIFWSTYPGGNGWDEDKEIQLAADNSAVVLAGSTLTRLKPWGSRISSTDLGGNGIVKDMALEGSSILFLVSSAGTDSPWREPLDPACGNVSFVVKLDAATLRALDAACVGNSYIAGFAADSSGISLTGSGSSDLPLVNAWQPSIAGGNDAFATKLVLNHAPDCSAATASPGTLWPADGRFVSVSVRGLTDPDGDRITVALTSIYQDEWITRAGTPDATGLGTSTARLRASRLDGGNGRVYHLGFTGTDPRGGVCTGTVKVCVPISQGGTCVDGGARVDSTRAY